MAYFGVNMYSIYACDAIVYFYFYIVGQCGYPAPSTL